jgi:hypothetical protein
LAEREQVTFAIEEECATLDALRTLGVALVPVER